MKYLKVFCILFLLTAFYSCNKKKKVDNKTTVETKKVPELKFESVMEVKDFLNERNNLFRKTLFDLFQKKQLSKGGFDEIVVHVVRIEELSASIEDSTKIDDVKSALSSIKNDLYAKMEHLKENGILKVTAFQRIIDTDFLYYDAFLKSSLSA